MFNSIMNVVSRKQFSLVVLGFLAVVLCSPQPVCADWGYYGNVVVWEAYDQEAHSVIPDGSGGVIVAWDDWRNASDDDIYVQRLNAYGDALWPDGGVALCTATNDQWYPKLVSDGAGGAIVTWVDKRLGSIDEDIYAQRIDASGNVLWTANGVGVCLAGGRQLYPRIAEDGAGGAIICWQDVRTGGFDVYAQRVNSSGVVQWTTGGVGVCTTLAGQSSIMMVSDGGGGAIMAWVEAPSGPGSQYIYSQRVNGTGAVQWTASGVPVCTTPSINSIMGIHPDGAGGAIISWLNAVGGPFTGPLVQRVDPSGALLWTSGGVALTTTIDYYPAWISMAEDGSGGVIAAWQTGSDDIRAQKVNASGSVQWGSTGVGVCTTSAEQRYPSAVSDGAGGAIVAWDDDRYFPNGFDVYAQRLNSAGVTQWTANGVLVCDYSSDQSMPLLASNDLGGAIAVWLDERAALGIDLLAQYIKSNGELGNDEPAQEVPITTTAILLVAIAAGVLGGRKLTLGK